jgi:uncharacterized protein
MTMHDVDMELRVIESAVGRHLFVADGSRLYDMPDDGDITLDALGPLLDRIAPRERRRIDDLPLAPPALQSLSLNLAQACNMACSYCYADEGKFGGRARMMSFEVARAGVDRLIAEAAPSADLLVGFMGGEPFLHRALMRDIVPYALKRARASGRSVRFSVTTNATMLTEDDIRLLVDHDFQVAISIDGPKSLNDAQRPLNGGGSAYDRVVAALDKFGRLGRPRHLSAPDFALLWEGNESPVGEILPPGRGRRQWRPRSSCRRVGPRRRRWPAWPVAPTRWRWSYHRSNARR